MPPITLIHQEFTNTFRNKNASVVGNPCYTSFPLVCTRTVTDLAMCRIGKRDGGLAHALRIVTDLAKYIYIIIRKGDYIGDLAHANACMAMEDCARIKVYMKYL